MIECALNKYQDFAMEFHSDGKGNVRYEGLSVFGAEKKGAYSGNTLGDQAYLESFFIEHFGNEAFQRLKEVVRKLSGKYTALSIPATLVYRQASDNAFAIHPCIEVKCGTQWAWPPCASARNIWHYMHARHAHHLPKQAGRSLRASQFHEKSLPARNKGRQNKRRLRPPLPGNERDKIPGYAHILTGFIFSAGQYKSGSYL